MSRFARGGMLLLLVAAPVARGRGQLSQAALADRVNRSVADVRQKELELQARRRAMGEDVTFLDTLRIANGNVVIVTTRGDLPLVQAAAARADSGLQVMGAATLAAVNGAAVKIHVDTTGRAGEGRAPVAVIEYGELRGGSVQYSSVTPEAIATVIESQTTMRYLNRYMGGSESAFGRWHHGSLPLRESDRVAPSNWNVVRSDILGTRSVLGSRCYKGELTACSMMLGLTPVDDPVMMWYDSLARFDEARLHKESAMRVDRVSAESCYAGSDAACARILRSMHRLEYPPAGGFAREALVREALRVGGPGAVQRLLESRGKAAAALEAAAGVPIDSVLRRWQKQVREGTLRSHDLTWLSGLAFIGWMAVLLFAATRISRWR